MRPMQLSPMISSHCMQPRVPLCQHATDAENVCKSAIGDSSNPQELQNTLNEYIPLRREERSRIIDNVNRKQVYLRMLDASVVSMSAGEALNHPHANTLAVSTPLITRLLEDFSIKVKRTNTRRY